MSCACQVSLAIVMQGGAEHLNRIHSTPRCRTPRRTIQHSAPTNMTVTVIKPVDENPDSASRSGMILKAAITASMPG